jgi:hypothetical protein
MNSTENETAFVFTADHHYKMVWFAQGGTTNLMGAVFKHATDEKWTLLFRFRNMQSIEGESQWYKVPGESPDKLIASFDQITTAAAKLTGKLFDTQDRVALDCDGETAIEHLLKKSWFHVVPNAPGGDA